MQLLDREYGKVHTGMDAIQKAREVAAPYEGAVTPEKLLAANDAYVEAAAGYGGTDNMPEGIFCAAFGTGGLAASVQMAFSACSGMFYELLIHNTFLKIGAASIWSPYVTVCAAAACIVVFVLLTVRSYKKHEAV